MFICLYMFIYALFIIIQTGNNPFIVILKRQYYRDRTWIKGCQGLGVGEGLTIMRHRGIFFRWWNDYIEI